MLKLNIIVHTCLFMVVLLAGCSGVQTFQSSLRAGDTAIVAAGMKQNFSRDNITVTITPSIGSPLIFFPGHPAVRAVINMYPDPLSSLIISEETNQNITPFALSYADSNKFFTGGDKDMWQTTVFVNLPATLPTGLTNIRITNTQGVSAESSVEIVSGIGQEEVFDAEVNGPMTPTQLSTLERVQHFEISFSGSVIPHAIQVEFNHDATADIGGAGKAYVSNPRGDIKSITWNDNGNILRTVITPSQSTPLTNMSDFKFYVSGGVTNLSPSVITPVDINGSPVAGVTVNVTPGK